MGPGRLGGSPSSFGRASTFSLYAPAALVRGAAEPSSFSHGGVDGERRDIADDEFGVRDARGVDGDGDDASFGFGEDAVADAQV